MIEYLSKLDYVATLRLLEDLTTALIGALVLMVLICWLYPIFTDRRADRRLPW